MSLTDKESTQKVLWMTAIYLLVCGLSATVAPSSWLWASGLPTTVSNELELAFGVIGAYLTALGIGALIASRAPEKHSGLIATLLLCNIFDFLATLRAVVSGSLPVLNGGLFIAVTLFWSSLLCVAFVGSRRMGGA